MDASVTLNLLGYVAVAAAGMVLGTLFGRSIASEFAAAMRAMESRVSALETTLHFTNAAKADPTAEAIKSHAAATEKLAAAISTQAATAPAPAAQPTAATPPAAQPTATPAGG